MAHCDGFPLIWLFRNRAGKVCELPLWFGKPVDGTVRYPSFGYWLDQDQLAYLNRALIDKHLDRAIHVLHHFATECASRHQDDWWLCRSVVGELLDLVLRKVSAPPDRTSIRPAGDLILFSPAQAAELGDALDELLRTDPPELGEIFASHLRARKDVVNRLGQYVRTACKVPSEFAALALFFF